MKVSHTKCDTPNTTLFPKEIANKLKWPVAWQVACAADLASFSNKPHKNTIIINKIELILLKSCCFITKCNHAFYKPLIQAWKQGQKHRFCNVLMSLVEFGLEIYYFEYLEVKYCTRYQVVIPVQANYRITSCSHLDSFYHNLRAYCGFFEEQLNHSLFRTWQ